MQFILKKSFFFIPILSLIVFLYLVQPASAALDQVILTNALFLTAEKDYYNEAIQADLETLDSPLASHKETIGGRRTAAAEMIWLGSQHMDFGINPKVLLVNLQVLGWLDSAPNQALMPFVQEMAERLWSGYSAYLSGERGITLQNGTTYQARSGANAATFALARYFAARMRSETEVNDLLVRWRNAYDEIYGYDPALEADLYMPHAIPVVEPFLELPYEQPDDRFIQISSFFDHAVPGIFDDSILRFDGKTLSPGAFSTCILGVSCYGGHNALDYRTGAGMPMRAAADGVVVYKYFNTDSSAGRVDSGLYIDHNNGYRTAYWHMDPILVNYGQAVKAGDIIGLSGNIGQSSGPHLHFGLRLVEENKPVDPYGWWSTSVGDYWGDSYWMWKGDLIADSDEAQAQLFYTSYWWRETRGYGGDSDWTWEVSSPSSSSNWGIWGAYLHTPGQYNIYAHWPRDAANTKKARYQVYHSGGMSAVQVDQSANGDQFVYLGTFNFDRGAAAVILTDYTGETGRKVQFDAVKWELTSGTPTPVPLGSGTYDDNDSRLQYSGSWVLDLTSGPYQDTRHFSTTAGSKVDLDFTGQQIGLAFTTDSDRGELEVYIDGVLTEVIDQRSASISWQQRWLSLPVPNGWHHLELRHGGGGVVDLDAVMIYGQVQTGTPVLEPSNTPTGTPTLTPTRTPTATAVPRVNLALNKPASQSSTFGSRIERVRASNAVDGNTSGIFWDDSTTHTENESQPWWQVDLGSVQDISQVSLWNRTDCCGERLSNFYVLVSNTPFVSGSLDAVRSQSGVSAFYVSAQAGRPTTLDINRAGRYVRIQLSGSNYLSLSEVQVWNLPQQSVTTTTTATTQPAAHTPTPTQTVQAPTITPTPTLTRTATRTSTTAPNRVNLALNKPASQSSTFGSRIERVRASNAVDGNTSGIFWDDSTTHTENESQPWWQVDLGSIQDISQVSLWNRTDCCGERLSSFYVLVSNTPFVSGSLDAVRSQSGVSAFYVSAQAGRPTTLDINRAGRYVRIQLSGSNYLSLSEVQVWNLPQQSVTATTTATTQPAAHTPTPTQTVQAPTITPTPTLTRTATPTPTTVVSGPPYAVQPDSPLYIPNFAHPEAGDNWLGVAGQVFNVSGQPVSSLVVVIEGTLLGEPFEGISLTGLSSSYGPGGYEIVLNNAPVVSSGTLSITLYNLAGQAVSEPFFFNTFADPLKNLLIINFEEQ